MKDLIEASVGDAIELVKYRECKKLSNRQIASGGKLNSSHRSHRSHRTRCCPAVVRCKDNGLGIPDIFQQQEKRERKKSYISVSACL